MFKGKGGEDQEALGKIGEKERRKWVLSAALGKPGERCYPCGEDEIGQGERTG